MICLVYVHTFIWGVLVEEKKTFLSYGALLQNPFSHCVLNALF